MTESALLWSYRSKRFLRMTKYSVVIVDDEEKARNGIEAILEKDPEIDILKLCKNGLEAIEAISKYRPHIVFMDIQMPQINGFEVLNNVEYIPQVIFTTAYDEYALKAFEIHALDYLLKPFSDERLFHAVSFAKKTIQEKELARSKRSIQSLLSEYPVSDDKILFENDRPSDRLAIKASGKILLIPFKEIERFEAFDYYIKIHTTSSVHLMRQSLRQIEAQLPKNFIRIHRSHIVNSISIKEIKKFATGDFEVVLKNMVHVRGSRKHRSDIKNYIKHL